MPYSRRKFLQLAAALTAGLSLGAGPAGLPHRVLGRTGERVSLLGLGGAHIGTIGDLDEAGAIALMRTAIDAGITFFDNAYSYSNGLSEERMGRALADGYRNRVFLMSKEADRDPAVAIARLEESLTRLRTDRLDLWQFHAVQEPDDPARIYESGLLDAALKARQQGKIRYLGFTGHYHPALHLEMIERGFPWDTMQMPVNILDPHYLSFVEQVLPVAVERGIGVIAMKTLAGTPGSIPRTGIATAAECLRYAMSLPVSTVCSGMDSREKLQHNLAVARSFEPLDESELVALVERTAALGESGKHEGYKRRS